MKRPILKFSMTVPLPFLLALLLIVSFSSCSKRNLGDTVIARLTEKNEGYRLMGIEEAPFRATYKFRGRLLEKVKLEGTPEGTKLWGEKFKPFAEWAGKERLQEVSKEETGGYTAENARLFLSLLKEWRDNTQTESA